MRRKGFTLIELLIVIAIIALLAAILFPVFATARDRARQASCTSNMKQIYLGYRQYAQDYDNSYALSAVLGAAPIRYVDDTMSLPYLLSPYTKSTGIWFCPSEKTEQIDAGIPAYWWPTNDAQLRAPDNYENVGLSQPLLTENYAYKTPPPQRGVAYNSSTNKYVIYSSVGEKFYCAHVGGKNFNLLQFDGHVTLYPWKSVGSLCK